MTSLRRCSVGVVALLLLAAACGGGDDDSSSSGGGASGGSGSDRDSARSARSQEGDGKPVEITFWHSMHARERGGCSRRSPTQFNSSQTDVKVKLVNQIELRRDAHEVQGRARRAATCPTSCSSRTPTSSR